MSDATPFGASTPLSENELIGLQLTFLEDIEDRASLAIILAGAVRHHHLSPFATLYRQDEPVTSIYILASGIINQYREDIVEGKRVRRIVRTVKAGKLLGHLEFLYGSAYATNARSEEYCHLISINIHAFSRLLYRFPQIRNRLLSKEVADRLSTFPFMRTLPLPSHLHPIVWGFLADDTKIDVKKPGEVVYRVGSVENDIFLIHQGQIKIEQNGDPEETHLLGNGAMFGSARMAAGFIGLGSIDREMVHDATSQTNTLLYRIPYHNFKSLTGLEPEDEIRQGIERREREISRLVIFSTIDDKTRRTIVGFVSHAYIPNTHLIIHQGEIADSLWVLVSGRAAIRALDKDGNQMSNAMATGPTYFAEQALLGQIPQQSTVEAQPGSEWLRFHWRDLEAASRQLKVDLRNRLFIQPSSQLQERSQNSRPSRGESDGGQPQGTSDQIQYDWLQPGERVLLRTRRHWISFLRKNLPAIIIFLFAMLGFLIAGFLPGTQYYLRALIIFLLVIDGVALAWGTIDYLNDWLAITDTRVVHQEKVLFVNEWRKEAPLEQIQNVDFSTTWLGKILDYGTLTIATAARVGTITFDFSTNFRQLREKIIEQRRVRISSTTAASKLHIQQMLEKRLGIAINIPSRVYHGGPQTTEVRTLRRRLSHGVETHLHRERGNRIIWRKHWLVLLPRLWLPLLIFLLMALFAALPPLTEMLGMPGETVPFLNALTIVGVLLTLIALGNVIWVIADWRNDTYEVSSDEIVHVDRMPLGLSEDRKSANLGRIQNVEMSIPSTLHWLFNYGNVICQTAAETGDFIFYGVPDPRAVAREILARMGEHKRKAEQKTAEERSQDLPDWFELYNRIEPEILEERAQRNG
jgi:CRP-like cAMP-binding protein